MECGQLPKTHPYYRFRYNAPAIQPTLICINERQLPVPPPLTIAPLLLYFLLRPILSNSRPLPIQEHINKPHSQEPRRPSTDKNQGNQQGELITRCILFLEELSCNDTRNIGVAIESDDDASSATVWDIVGMPSGYEGTAYSGAQHTDVEKDVSETGVW